MEKRLAALPYRCLPPSKWTVEHVVDWAETSFDWALPTRVRKTPTARLLGLALVLLLLFRSLLPARSLHSGTRCNDVDRCLAVVLPPAGWGGGAGGAAGRACPHQLQRRRPGAVWCRAAGGWREYRREQMLAVLHDPWTWGFE